MALSVDFAKMQAVTAMVFQAELTLATDRWSAVKAEDFGVKSACIDQLCLADVGDLHIRAFCTVRS